MHEHDPELTQDNSARVLSSCPQCDTELAILRVIAGRGGCEYWTMRCPRCGGIHLDIVGLSRPPLTA